MSGVGAFHSGGLPYKRKGSKLLTQVSSFVRLFRARLSTDEGATMVEYGIMVALIAVVSVLVVGVLGVDVFNAFDTAQQNIDSTSTPLTPTP